MSLFGQPNHSGTSIWRALVLLVALSVLGACGQEASAPAPAAAPAAADSTPAAEPAPAPAPTSGFISDDTIKAAHDAADGLQDAAAAEANRIATETGDAAQQYSDETIEKARKATEEQMKKAAAEAQLGTPTP